MTYTATKNKLKGNQLKR